MNINEAKSCSLKKMSKIHKPLGEKEKTQFNQYKQYKKKKSHSHIDKPFEKL